MNIIEESSVKNNVSDSLQTVASSGSLRDDCINIIFSQLEFLPWDNPDNIISEDVETIVGQVKNNALVLLFVIGGPVNIINMVVFFKQGLRDRVNLLLFALSLADELYLISCMFIHAEQMYIQFTTKERFGPITIFMSQNNLLVFTSFSFVSRGLSAIIAIERCLCVFNPLKFHTLLRTRTMAVIIVMVYVVVLTLFFMVAFRFRFGCVYDPETGVAVTTAIAGEFYVAHKEFLDRLDSFVFGVGLPGVVVIVVTTTTTMTIVRLRRITIWRSGTSTMISAREVALTKMLVGNSLLFIACISPSALIRVGWLFFPQVNAGRRNHNLFLAGIWFLEILTYVNATFNFFVYYVMGSRYRETFWALFGRKNSV